MGKTRIENIDGGWRVFCPDCDWSKELKPDDDGIDIDEFARWCEEAENEHASYHKDQE